MRANPVRERFEAGQMALCGWYLLPSPDIIEATAGLGLDGLIIDFQHGLMDSHEACAMLKAARAFDVTTIVRVPWNEPGIMMRMLDHGADGIIAPMINSAAEARALVDACRYPPLGKRSFGPVRAGLLHGADYVARANDYILLLAMIETQDALDALDDILAVDGLDGILIGPNDLAISLAQATGQDYRAEPTRSIVLDIKDRAQAAGRKVAIYAGDGAEASQRAGEGFDMASLSADLAPLMAAVRAQIGIARS